MDRLQAFRDQVAQVTGAWTDDQIQETIKSPVIVLSAPRAGSTLLFELLAKQAGLWTIGGESHAVFANFPELRASNATLDSMALSEDHANKQTANQMRRIFLALLKNNMGVPYLNLPNSARPANPVMLEKTPRNALNVPFLLKIFPDARFVFLLRDPIPSIASLMEAWDFGLRSGRFVTFRDLPGWHLPAWCFVLPEGWRDLSGKSLSEIAAFQWAACQTAIMDGLESLPTERVVKVSYQGLIDDPNSVLDQISSGLGLQFKNSVKISGSLPLSRTTLTKPDPDKWRKFESEINGVLPSLEATISRARSFMQT